MVDALYSDISSSHPVTLTGVSLSLLATRSGTSAIVIMLGVLIVATVTDMRRRKIPNWITFPAALMAFAVHGLLSGGYGLASSVLAFLVWFSLGFAFYQVGAQRGIGAGDIKLIMACGALVGFWPSLHIAFVSFLLQVLYMFVRWLHEARARENLKRIGTWLRSLSTPGSYKIHFESAGPQDTSPHAPFLLSGAVAVLVFWGCGWLNI